MRLNGNLKSGEFAAAYGLKNAADPESPFDGI
jgi:hypothetical protein